MKKVMIVLWLALIYSSGTIAYAGDVCTWAESKSWSVSAPGKLTRGVLNAGLGWSNLLVQPFRGESVMGGIGKGMSEFFVRTFQGIGEILTFWLPPVPDEPLKECVFYDWGMMEKP